MCSYTGEPFFFRKRILKGNCYNVLRMDCLCCWSSPLSRASCEAGHLILLAFGSVPGIVQSLSIEKEILEDGENTDSGQVAPGICVAACLAPASEKHSCLFSLLPNPAQSDDSDSFPHCGLSAPLPSGLQLWLFPLQLPPRGLLVNHNTSSQSPTY